MKLVVDLRLINSSGIGTYIKNVFPGIINNFEEILVLGRFTELSKFEWFSKVSFKEFDHEIYSLTEQLQYLKIPKSDLLWIPHFNAPLLPIKAKKLIVTIHDVNHLSNPQYYSILKRFWAFILYKNAVVRSKFVFTVSKFSKSEIISILNSKSKKIQVVYCGIDRDYFNNNKAIELKLGLPEKYLLYVGNIKPHKNLLVLLKAYMLLDEKNRINYRLVILGKREGFVTGDDRVSEFIKSNNLDKHIHFTGYVEDTQVPWVYHKSSAFIFPSLYEGFGLPLLEAMACKIPVLSSYRASLKEVGGDAALYFDPENEWDLANKIDQILNDQRLRDVLIKKGLHQIEKFEWSSSIQKHLKIFNKLR